MYLKDLANLENALPLLSIEKVLHFCRLIELARPTVEFHTEDLREAPLQLPFRVQLILARALKETTSVISTIWEAVRLTMWSNPKKSAATEDDINLFNKNAHPLGTSYNHLYPPTRVCKTFGCKNHRTSNEVMTLKEPVTYKASLFTLKNGSLPVYTTSLYCRSCGIRYYPNYAVKKSADMREYYGGVPCEIQVSQHHFFEARLLEFFSTSKTFGWMSAMNLARIYNISMAKPDSHIANNSLAFLEDPASLSSPRSSYENWQTSLEARQEDVMNGFFLYSLLLEKAERGESLWLSHNNPSQRDRLDGALAERNKQMEGIGQEHYAHACDLCLIVSEDEEGNQVKLQAAVCDGITIGHPRCGVHDCTMPLTSIRDRFCPGHRELLDKCAVVDCEQKAGTGFKTCAQKAHRAAETAYFYPVGSLFKLQDRLKRAGHAGLEDASSLKGDSTVTGSTEAAEDSCEGKPEEGNVKIKTYFGQKMTHNEQLIMRCCGVILSRATFFGSEAISSVNIFAKSTFPTPESTPEYFVFDNNCKLDAHQRAICDEHFKDTGKPVDPFHFTCKHKETDTHCQKYCNPAAFPELIKDGKWRFNTSICEQTNAWLGGYQAILRNMSALRFNFYLDEVIKRRNRYIVSQLEAGGHHPFSIPISTLFPNV